ncbi:MAG: hypothetical protein ACRBFS_00275 [Aureispira sp.]
MKKYCHCSIVIILMAFASSCGNLPSQEELATMSLEERWAYLEEGQPLEEVHHLLGEPVRTIQKGNISLDQYDCALCLTKVDKHNGLLAWNLPVKGFEEEAQLFYIGEAPSDLTRTIMKSLSSSISSGKESIKPYKENMEEVLDDLFQEIESLQGEKGQQLKETLQKNTVEGLEELRRFLKEDVGEHTEEWLALQKELMEKGWEEHGDEAIEFLDELTEEIKNLKVEDVKINNKNEPTAKEKEQGRPETRAAQWAAIKEGMTEEEVVGILGEPKSKKHWSGNIDYKYECFHCKVVFNERGKVWAWHSPEL